MRSRVNFLLALILSQHCSDALYFALINAITAASRHRQVSNKLESIQQGISVHRAETRREFGKVNNKLDNIHGTLNEHHQQTQQGFGQVLTALGNLGDNIAEGRKEAQNNFRRTTEQINNLQYTVDDNHISVLKNFALSFDLFYYIGSNLNMVSTNVRDILDLVGSQKETDPNLGAEIVQLNAKIDKVNDNYAKINKAFDNFMVYSKDIFDFNNYTLMDYAMASLSHNGDSPMTILKDIYDTFLRDDGLLSSYLKQGVGEHLVCSKTKTPQQSLFALYKMAVFAEAKALLVMSFSFNLKEYFGKGTFSRERIKEVDSCIERLNSLGARVEVTLRASKSYLWTCDSPSKQIGNDYLQFTNFIQGYLVYNPRSNDPKQCERMTACSSLGSGGTTCRSNAFPPSHVCNGDVFGCTPQNHSIESICLANAPKRYSSAKLSFGKQYGDGLCGQSTKLLESCGYCLCYCDEDKSLDAERFISLDAAISDHLNDRVVTGVRFIKHFGVIHLQIQEAILGPLGMVNTSVAHWVPVGADSPPQKFTLTREKNAIDIDIFNGKPGHVLTGVRFREVSHGVTLEVRLTPYNPENGEIDPSYSMWSNNMNKKTARQKINVGNVRPPTAAQVAPNVRSTTNQYVEVTTTGMVEDVAQTVIPFFDARFVQPSQLIPLSGFGLQYKSSGDRYGGYIAPVLVSFNYADNIDKNFQTPKLNTTHPSLRARSSSAKFSCSNYVTLLVCVYVLYL